MKNILLAITITFVFSANAQSVAINNDGSTAETSAILDLKSTNQGVLLPRMTAAQRGLITTPATGLIVYQTDATIGFYFYNGSAWTNLNGNNGQSVPNGGTANQVLGKIDGTDYNTSWISPNSSDNVGNHTAAQTLNMNSNPISNATNITATGTATLGGNTYPTSTGTDGQVLKTNGAGALSWATSSNKLVLRALESNRRTLLPIADGSTIFALSAPFPFSAVSIAPPADVGTFVVGPSTFETHQGYVRQNLARGRPNIDEQILEISVSHAFVCKSAGFYLVDVSIKVEVESTNTIASSITPTIIVFDNPTGQVREVYMGTSVTSSTAFQSGARGRGAVTHVVYLGVDDTVFIGLTNNSATAYASAAPNGGNIITIVKL